MVRAVSVDQSLIFCLVCFSVLVNLATIALPLTCCLLRSNFWFARH